MLRLSFLVAIFASVVLLATNLSIRAQNSPPAKIVVATTVKKGVITFSWPVMRGKWSLYEQQPPFTGEWKPLADDLHHTNKTTVTLSLPVPAATALFQVRRGFRFHAPPPIPTSTVPPRPAKRPPTSPPAP